MLTETQLLEFTKGRKITVIKQNDFGFPSACKIKVESARLKDWAQYTNCLFITGTIKGKRKPFGILLKRCDIFTIFDGWVDVSDTAASHITENGTKISHFGFCFDKETLEKASQVDAPIIFKNNLGE